MPNASAGPQAALIPGLFVVIWATGFVTARLVAPYAEPLAFVTMRVAATAVVLAAIARIGRVRCPPAEAWRNALIGGMLMQGVYVAGVFWAVHRGLPAGIAALVGSLQPLLTAAVAGPLLGERVGRRRWTGIGVGFSGAAMVLVPKLGGAGTSAVPPSALAVCLMAMAAMTLGTLWQKRTGGGVDPLANAAIQFAGATLLLLPVATLFGTGHFDLEWPLVLGFSWSVLGNSVAGILLLMALIRRGAVAGVASLLFLVPPVSAVMAYALFGETLAPVQIVGMAVAAGGVALASRG